MATGGREAVNVVFVGYDQPAVSRSAFLGALPRRYEPVVRSRLPYGIVETLGLHYTYDHTVTFADRTYEDKSGYGLTTTIIHETGTPTECVQGVPPGAWRL